jgi:NADH:ubiquinone reductase (H+-translocating)
VADTRHRVVVVGSGFAGLFAIKRLRRAPVDVTVIDRTTHHLFQPLLYQVATGILSEGEIAPPIRDILRHQRNASVVLAEVTGIDVDAHAVTSRTLAGERVIPYDSLIVAAGAGSSYFGHDEFADEAPGLKTIDDALELRARIFGAFEMAEMEDDPAARASWLTFAIVGGGATGVEMAGQIAELARNSLRSNFRRIDLSQVRIVLVDGLPRLLSAYSERLSDKAAAELRRLGVEIHLGVLVSGVDRFGLDLEHGNPDLRRIEARTKVWAAGVRASPLSRLLADATGAKLDRGGRIKVAPNCSLPGHDDVYVVGDMMSLAGLPGLAEVAMQSGRHAAVEISRRLSGKLEPRPFAYRDLGSLAAVSRSFAVAQRGRLQLAGWPAWLLWLIVHLTFLTGFKNRVSTVFHWALSFIGRGRAERTFTVQQVFARRSVGLALAAVPADHAEAVPAGPEPTRASSTTS